MTPTNPNARELSQYAPFDPGSAFPHFYTNPKIASMAPRRAWTISDADKMPINIQELVATGRLFGARPGEAATSLMTLPEITEAVPAAANLAYRFDAQLDGCLLLDIESTCPPEVALDLLSLADQAYYTETSMSGRGYHLIMPIPANIQDFPHATGRSVLKHPHGWFEVLLDHWITFTRNPVDPQLLSQAKARADDTAAWLGHQRPTWEAVFANLGENTGASLSYGLAFDPAELAPDDQSPAQQQRDADVVEAVLATFVTRYSRDLHDFHGDASRWEFSQLSVLTSMTMEALRHHPQILTDRSQLTPSLAARLIYTSAVEVIEPRDKHDEYRNGMPFLLYRTVSCLERDRWVDFEDQEQGHQEHRGHHTEDRPAAAEAAAAAAAATASATSAILWDNRP